jgi:hypothetical protein
METVDSTPQQQRKRKLPQEVTPKEEQNKKLRVKQENDNNEKIGQKMEKQAKEKTNKIESKESSEDQQKKSKAAQQIPQISPEKTKAIVAEEEQRRAERNNRSIFLKSEMLTKMKPGEIKALHPAVVSVRQHNQVIQIQCLQFRILSMDFFILKVKVNYNYTVIEKSTFDKLSYCELTCETNIETCSVALTCTIY